MISQPNVVSSGLSFTSSRTSRFPASTARTSPVRRRTFQRPRFSSQAVSVASSPLRSAAPLRPSMRTSAPTRRPSGPQRGFQCADCSGAPRSWARSSAAAASRFRSSAHASSASRVMRASSSRRAAAGSVPCSGVGLGAEAAPVCAAAAGAPKRCAKRRRASATSSVLSSDASFGAPSMACATRSRGQSSGRGVKSTQVPSGMAFHQYLSATKAAPAGESRCSKTAQPRQTCSPAACSARSALAKLCSGRRATSWTSLRCSGAGAPSTATCLLAHRPFLPIRDFRAALPYAAGQFRGKPTAPRSAAGRPSVETKSSLPNQ
mmetsp:Transcript_75890/g.240086  ORF Transcript_75890/g.240086 Transcript_75890/m.240086 type:complete len:320 (-) Transcript_75890:101-1060(-)